jgi:hypothetical protein
VHSSEGVLLARLRKDVLRPATYSVPDRSGKKRNRVTFDRDYVRRLHSRYHDMKAAGLHVPVSWEHQDSAKPDDEAGRAQRLADKARLIFGYAEDAVIEPGDLLQFDLDIPNDADASQAKVVRYVSPEIVNDFVDGSGRLWEGPSITHIAVTGKPVQHAQQPFQQLSYIRLSLADIDTEPPMTIDLKPVLAYLAKRKINIRKGTKPEKLLTRLHACRLGFEDEGDEGEEKAEKEVEGDGEGKAMKKALEYLEGQGVHLPPDTNAENFIERLCVACHALENSKEEEDVETPNPNEPPASAEQPKPADTGGMMMSLERDLKASKARAEAAEARLLKSEKEGLQRRIGALSVSKPIRDKLLASLKTERLSLTEDGALAMSELVTTVKAYEALDKDSINPVLLSLNRGTSKEGDKPSVIPNPDEGSGLDDHVMSRMTGGRYKTATNGTAN